MNSQNRSASDSAVVAAPADFFWMDTPAAAERGDFSVSFMEKLRQGNDGPPFAKIGRAVRYRSDLFDAWMAGQIVLQK